MPYTGGSKNFMTHSLYDSIACFAYWEAMPEEKRETVEEFTGTVALVFNGAPSKKKRNPEFLTANNKMLLKAVAGLLRLVFAPMNRKVDSGSWNNAWRVKINPDKPEEGLQMVLVGCPIVDFAKKHGYMELMPAMCNPDYENRPEFGIHLIRPKTVGMGYDICDYHLVGDRSAAAKLSPVRRDEKGFLVNDVPDGERKSRKNNWDLYAPVYNLFMKKDQRVYEQMYGRIRRVIAGKRVLELATGTGLIAKNVAEAAECLEATDFSEKMIREAKKGKYPSNCHFSVADACDLPYPEHTFDAVIISNALHIMPEPEKALAEIGRVLKPEGLLIAPTFTHGRMALPRKMLSQLMAIVGFHPEHKWTEEAYLSFLQRNGWHIIGKKTLAASFPLTYAECRKENG